MGKHRRETPPTEWETPFIEKVKKNRRMSE